MSYLMLLFFACGEKEPNVPEIPEPSGNDLPCEVEIDSDCDGSYNDVDCDPNDGLVYPGAPEIPYDGKDNDCAGDGDLNDVDGDGYIGGPDGDDCNDSRADTYPGAEEICYDGIDQNCAGDLELENANDCDGDGHIGRGEDATDCDDTNPNINADAEEIWYNGVDDNCDSHNDYDQDFDGQLSDEHGGIDCDDTDPLTMALDPNSNIISNERWDMVDRDCNGVVDNLRFYDALRSYSGSALSGDSQLGNAMAFLDDLDGDGMREIAISSPYGNFDENGSNPGGWVHIFSPATDNTYQFPSEAAMATAEGTTGQYLGWDISRIGDIDGDGLTELAVGAYGSSKTIVYASSAMQQGGALPSGTALASLSGPNYNGVDVVELGDMNGDGIPEVGSGTGIAGAAWLGIWDGATVAQGGNLGSASVLVQYSSSSDGGESVGNVDFDGDGKMDVAVPFGNKIALVLGSDIDIAPEQNLSELIYVSGSSANGFGYHNGVVHDLDGDGYAELMAGEPFASIDSEKEGRVFLIDGDDIINAQTGSASAIAMITFEGISACATLLAANESGDFDNDGVPDIVVSQSFIDDTCNTTVGVNEDMGGVFMGSSLQSGSTYTFDQRNSTFVAQNIYTGMGWGNAVGDVDFDGDDDFMIGAPFALEFQLKNADGEVIALLDSGRAMLFVSNVSE